MCFSLPIMMFYFAWSITFVYCDTLVFRSLTTFVKSFINVYLKSDVFFFLNFCIAEIEQTICWEIFLIHKMDLFLQLLIIFQCLFYIFGSSRRIYIIILEISQPSILFWLKRYWINCLTNTCKMSEKTNAVWLFNCITYCIYTEFVKNTFTTFRAGS